MKARASVIAQKLLNLYRQAHVIVGGWGAVNRVFVDEATDEILHELQDLPTGKMLIQHIKNLRDGTTPMDSIARELLPYGGMMNESADASDMADDELQQLISAIDSFNPSLDGINQFMANPIIKKFGDDWVSRSKNALFNNPEALRKFDDIVRAATAYRMWDNANDVLSKPITERARANLQQDEHDAGQDGPGSEKINRQRRMVGPGGLPGG